MVVSKLQLLVLAAALTAPAGCAHCLQSPDSCATWLDAGPPMICDGLLGGLTTCSHAVGAVGRQHGDAAPQAVAKHVHPGGKAEASRTAVFQQAQYLADETEVQTVEADDSEIGAEPLPMPAPADGASVLQPGSDNSVMHLGAGGAPVVVSPPLAAHAQGCDCGGVVRAACSICPAKHMCHVSGCPLLHQPPLGPMPIRYRPAMPPKFIPVPTRPVQSRVRLDAPAFQRGAVASGYEPELRFEARD